MTNPEMGPQEPEKDLDDLRLDDPETIEAEKDFEAVKQQTNQATEKARQQSAEAKKTFSEKAEAQKKVAQGKLNQEIEEARNKVAESFGVSRGEYEDELEDAEKTGRSVFEASGEKPQEKSKKGWFGRIFGGK